MEGQEAKLVSEANRRYGLLARSVVAVVLIGGLSLLASPAYADPPGDNGTIKVDREPFDTDPGNEPMVGCRFEIDFYGFDEGDFNAEVSFATQSPTRPAGTVLLEDTVFIGEDSNAGGGSEAGLDASKAYTLDFTGFTPHSPQGFHVKLTIHADGSQGADTKYKVFWVKPCEANGGTNGGTGSSTTSSTTTTTLGGTNSSGGGSNGDDGSSSNLERRSEDLGDTGSNAVPMMVVGLAMLGLGAASLLVSHWRQRRSDA